MHGIFSTFGIVLTLCLPGYCMSLVFFKHGEIDVIERVGLAFALSLAIIPLLVFYTNLIGVPITVLTVTAQVIGVILMSAIIYSIQILKKR